MRRVLAARTITQNAALLILDQKGDEEDVEQMSRLAAAADVPFVLIDPLDPDSDRYQPLWGTPAQVAARAVEPIKQSEPYYYDVLRLHLDTICRVLHAADKWPPSVPFLIDACHPLHYEALTEIAHKLDDRHRDLIRRVQEHGTYVSSRKGNEDLSGGAARLQVALALAGREIVTPRITPEGDAVGVSLVNALKERAVVMWRMHADVMPDEAAAMTVLALADLHDAAGQAGVPWTLMLDEFGAVIKMAASRAVAILQRGRSHGGQVIVVTQSVADPRSAVRPGRPAAEPDRQLLRRCRAPPNRPRIARLAREADGNQSSLAIDEPDHRPRHQPLRARLGPTRTRVQDRVGHVRRTRARRGDHLHDAGAGSPPGDHPSSRVRSSRAETNRRRIAGHLRAARPPRGAPTVSQRRGSRGRPADGA
jgi:hypothetical protein